MLNSSAHTDSPIPPPQSNLPSIPDLQSKPYQDKPKQPSKIKLTFLSLIFSVLLVIAFFVWRNQYQARQLELSGSKAEQQASLPDSSPPKPSPPKPSPPPVPILQGIETYTISQGKKNNGPKITQAIINPHDPKINDNQTVKVKLAYAQPINQVKLILTSDNDQKETDMKLVEGTATSGIWETSWQITDTILYNYSQTITAKSGDQTSTVTITIR